MIRAPWVLILLATVIGAALLASTASAHLMPAKRGTIHVTGNAAFDVIDVPAACLKFADDNHNGLIDTGELQRHQAAIRAAFLNGFSLSADGQPGQSVLVWLLLPQTGDIPVTGSSYIVAMERINFPAPPRHLTVTTTLFDEPSGMGQLSLAVRNDSHSEMAILTPDHNRQTLFRSLFETFTGFIGTGVTHILTGADHLLFLLTLVIGLKSWRQALAVTIAFTIAHSLTLSLSVMGLFRLSSAIVEPAIAASIVIVALDNILRGQQSAKQRVVVVFACGLLHGLGFASAIADFGLDWPHKIVSLVGFNIGVEIGQFTFIGTVLSILALVGFLWRRRGKTVAPDLWLHLTSATAAALGTLMLIMRVLPV